MNLSASDRLPAMVNGQPPKSSMDETLLEGLSSTDGARARNRPDGEAFSGLSSTDGARARNRPDGDVLGGLSEVSRRPTHDDRWKDKTYQQKLRIKGRFGALLVKVLSAGVRVTRHGWENDRQAYRKGTPVLYVHWHGSMVVPLSVFRDRGIIILTSLSRDGDIQDMCMNCLGFRTIRGSSSRGGAKALLALVKNLKQHGAAAMAVDGPRGPYQSSKPGAVLLAQKTGASVLPVGMAHSCCYHLNSWDKFEIPIPFSHSVLAVGEPFSIPPDWPIDRGQKELDSRIVATVDAATRRLRQ